jgi:hypothetical protein
MKQSTNQHRQWITKRASRECGANQVLYKRKAKQTDQCPLCQQVETVTHIPYTTVPRYTGMAAPMGAID